MRIKNQKAILAKFDIEELNEMQEEATLAIHSAGEVVVLSPTGSGKTLAFLLPIMSEIDRGNEAVQAIIIAPSRELVIQIEQVARQMGSGAKINAVYGGRHFSKDRQELKTPPSVLIGTPGRLADHLRRGTVSGEDVKILVLDEFDKSLEVGFEEEMSEIVAALPGVKKKVLTSATQGIEVPAFVGLLDPIVVDYSEQGVSRLMIRGLVSPTKDKLETLGKSICYFGGGPGIVFCNYKDSIQRVSDYLSSMNIPHGCFYGGMEQKDRERALIKFRNGTHQLLIATDLAARGIDVPEIKFIIHYHLPHRAEEFTHRNGRTARMLREGTAYVLHWEGEDLPDFIDLDYTEYIEEAPVPPAPSWTTLFISGGRQDKISKGDIAGLFFKQGELDRSELGVIELKQDCAFAAVHTTKVDQVVRYTNNTRLKKKKVRVHQI